MISPKHLKPPHQKLLLKTKTNNIDTDLLLLITDFVCNKKQCVGPLLFLIYIDDLPELCASEDPSSEIFLYADNSKMYKIIRNQSDQQKLQSMLNLI